MVVPSAASRYSIRFTGLNCVAIFNIMRVNVGKSHAGHEVPARALKKLLEDRPGPP